MYLRSQQVKKQQMIYCVLSSAQKYLFLDPFLKKIFNRPKKEGNISLLNSMSYWDLFTIVGSFLKDHKWI